MRTPLRLSVLYLTGVVAAAPVSGAALSLEQRFEILERQAGKVPSLTLELNELRRDNRELRGQVEELQYQLQRLERKQRDIYLDVDQRLSSLATSPVAPTAPAVTQPSDAAAQQAAPVSEPPGQTPAVAAPQVSERAQADYRAAYALLDPQRRWGDAAKAFQAFLDKYPNDVLRDNAQYWLAEAHYVSQDNKAALKAFETLVTEHPDSPKVPGALYKIGRIHKATGDEAAARKAFERVVRDYPSSSASGLAKRLLQQMKP